MQKFYALMAATALGLSLASCGGQLLDTTPAPLPLYIAMAPSDLAACDTVQISGIIPNLTDYQTNPGAYHLASKSAAYAKTPLASGELVVASSNSPTTLVVSRPGTYALPYASTFKYNWTLRLVCGKTATTSTVTLSGVFKNVNRAAVVTLTATAAGQVNASLQEYASTATPEQLNLP